jgi:anti-sigma B factor antagonist
MKLSTHQHGQVVVVTIDADNLDANSSRTFKELIAPILDKERKVAFDLGRLQFVDSSGLGVILSCLRTLNSRGGDLRLFGMTRPVRALFELVRMHRVFEIFNSCDEAVRSFS